MAKTLSPSLWGTGDRGVKSTRIVSAIKNARVILVKIIRELAGVAQPVSSVYFTYGQTALHVDSSYFLVYD